MKIVHRSANRKIARIHNHKFKILGKRIARVNQNRLGNNKRRRIVTERFEKLEDLVTNYSTLTAVQKTDQLFTYLYHFSHLENYNLDQPGSE